MAIPLYRPGQLEGNVTVRICTKFDRCGSDGVEVIGDLPVDGALFYTRGAPEIFEGETKQAILSRSWLPVAIPNLVALARTV